MSLGQIQNGMFQLYRLTLERIIVDVSGSQIYKAKKKAKEIIEGDERL